MEIRKRNERPSLSPRLPKINSPPPKIDSENWVKPVTEENWALTAAHAICADALGAYRETIRWTVKNIQIFNWKYVPIVGQLWWRRCRQERRLWDWLWLSPGGKAESAALPWRQVISLLASVTCQYHQACPCLCMCIYLIPERWFTDIQQFSRNWASVYWTQQHHNLQTTNKPKISQQITFNENNNWNKTKPAVTSLTSINESERNWSVKQLEQK